MSTQDNADERDGTQTIHVRTPAALVAEIDAHARELATKHGVAFTRSDAVIRLLQAGLREMTRKR